MRWQPAYVAFGSNLDDPRRQVEAALQKVAGLDACMLFARSRLYRSAPLGPQDQPGFINAAAGFLTRLAPRALLGALQAIELAMGRTEPPIRWGPRRIDLDLLLLGEACHDEPGLQLPHPGLHQRAFVLYPLAEFAPDLWVPGRGRIRTLAQQVEYGGLEPLAA